MKITLRSSAETTATWHQADGLAQGSSEPTSRNTLAMSNIEDEYQHSLDMDADSSPLPDHPSSDTQLAIANQTAMPTIYPDAAIDLGGSHSKTSPINGYRRKRLYIRQTSYPSTTYEQYEANKTDEDDFDGLVVIPPTKEAYDRAVAEKAFSGVFPTPRISTKPSKSTKMSTRVRGKGKVSNTLNKKASTTGRPRKPRKSVQPFTTRLTRSAIAARKNQLSLNTSAIPYHASGGSNPQGPSITEATIPAMTVSSDPTLMDIIGTQRFSASKSRTTKAQAIEEASNRIIAVALGKGFSNQETPSKPASTQALVPINEQESTNQFLSIEPQENTEVVVDVQDPEPAKLDVATHILESLLTLNPQFEINQPCRTGIRLPTDASHSTLVWHHYNHAVNWSDKHSVYKLNRWRQQKVRRVTGRLGTKTDGRVR